SVRIWVGKAVDGSSLRRSSRTRPLSGTTCEKSLLSPFLTFVRLQQVVGRVERRRGCHRTIDVHGPSLSTLVTLFLVPLSPSCVWFIFCGHDFSRPPSSIWTKY
ncbi:unnamed protein product, partial [Ectocarpus sp. 8 AP-2014]